MNPDNAPANEDDGVFGPEVLLNVQSGKSCCRLSDDSLDGPLPTPPLTNAFFVWVGRRVLVVSDGIKEANIVRVASGLRENLREPALPIVFSYPTSSNTTYRLVCDARDDVRPSDVAKAQMYALVQCGWEERDTTMLVDGQRIVFRVSFALQDDGTYFPVLSRIHGADSSDL